MIVGASAIGQIIQALAFLAVGVLAGAIWLLCEQLPMIRPLRVVIDTVLCLGITALFLVVVQSLNKGEILLFQPLCLLAGFFAIWKLFPRFAPKLAPPISPKLFVSKRTQMRMQNPDIELEDIFLVAKIKKIGNKFKTTFIKPKTDRNKKAALKQSTTSKRKTTHKKSTFSKDKQQHAKQKSTNTKRRFALANKTQTTRTRKSAGDSVSKQKSRIVSIT